MPNSIETDSLHPLEIKVLRTFETQERRKHDELIEHTDLNEGQVRRGEEWLLTRGLIETIHEDIFKEVSLSETGKEYLETEIPELRIIRQVKEGEGRVGMREVMSRDDMEKREKTNAIGELKKEGIIKIGKGGILSFDESISLEKYELTQECLRYISEKGTLRLNDLETKYRDSVLAGSRKRGGKAVFRVKERSVPTFSITARGREVLQQVAEGGLTGDEESRLTPEMLKDGSWKKYTFRKYNIHLPPPRAIPGHRHPYGEFLDFVKHKMIALGFEEMQGPIVETEFWNMDALFMPQFHSARQIHDAYFLKNPTHAEYIDEPYLEQVADAHERGFDTGSKGWGYNFDTKKTRRLIMRSHGTVLSARTLASKPKIPGKYFAIARCFRYDSVDATHAPDFFQIEGIVLDEKINFKNLLGLLKLFALEIARAKEIRFEPAYFPFTEPSVEVHMKHPRLGWMELGGSGIFRPEVTRPLGIDVPVIAWGLGLDRMAMVAIGVDDIRNLFSRDLNFIRSRKVEI